MNQVPNGSGILPVNCSSGGLNGTLVLLRVVAAKRLLTSPILERAIADASRNTDAP